MLFAQASLAKKKREIIRTAKMGLGIAITASLDGSVGGMPAW